MKSPTPTRVRRTVKKTIATYKAGDRVYVDGFGKGIVLNSYKVKGQLLYHIEQGEDLLGNIPESFIRSLPTTKSPKK